MRDLELLNKTCIITGITGNFTVLNEALPGVDHYCLTTNNTPAFKEECERKGWGHRHLEYLPHTENVAEASIQSKHIKFLMFLNHGEHEDLFTNYDQILYHDHKFLFYDQDPFGKHGYWQLMQNGKGDGTQFVALGQEFFSVFEEFFRCQGYDRYVEQRIKIRANIDHYAWRKTDLKGSKHYDGWRYCLERNSLNMSFLVWNNRLEGIDLFLHDLWEEQLKWDHAECQILFNLFYYDRKDIIYQISVDDMMEVFDRDCPERMVSYVHY